MEASVTGYPKEIAEAVAKVMGADLYVQKRGKNAFHGYKYATVGDLLDKLQPLMAEAGLVIFQHEMATDFVDSGSVMSVRYQFTLAHTSGAVWPEKPVHTGMCACRNTKGGFDDKAANKCHTAARKYFLLGLFQVPTGEDFREPVHDGDPDNDEQSEPRRQEMRRAEPRYGTASASPPVGAVVEDPFAPVEPAEHPSRQEALDEYARIELAINESRTPSQVDALWKAEGVTGGALDLIRHVSPDSYALLLGMAKGRKNELRAAA